jgi:hypothetical protein
MKTSERIHLSFSKRHPASKLWLVGFMMLFFVLACGLGDNFSKTPTPDTSLISTALSATLTALPVPDNNVTPTSFPATSPLPDTPTDSPPEESAITEGLSPAGVIAGLESGEVTVYNLAGQPSLTYSLPDLPFYEPVFIHFTGNFETGSMEVPLVYYSLEGGGVLKVSDGQTSSLYTDAPNLIAMAGAPAQPVIAYSLFVTPQSGYDTSSELYVGTLDAAPIDPILTSANEDGYALYPLAVEAIDGQPLGVWYTTQLWGIGNVAFAPQRGLYYIDLTTENVTTYLPAAETNDMGSFSYAPAGLSSDQSWVAYTIQGPNVAPYSMFWQPVEDPNQVKSLMPSINFNMGAGFAFFSPNNEFLAWDTANSGTQSGAVTYYLHITDTSGSGGSFSEFPTSRSMLAPDLVSASPVGWLDDQTLLLQGYLAGGSKHVMTFGPVDDIVNVNGQGQAIQAQLFVEGEFLGCVYP